MTFLVLLAGFAQAAEALEKQKFDVLLVLAVDCSESVDERELRLQLDGIAAAFRGDPKIVSSALSSTNGYQEWIIAKDV